METRPARRTTYSGKVRLKQLTSDLKSQQQSDADKESSSAISAAKSPQQAKNETRLIRELSEATELERNARMASVEDEAKIEVVAGAEISNNHRNDCTDEGFFHFDQNDDNNYCFDHRERKWRKRVQKFIQVQVVLNEGDDDDIAIASAPLHPCKPATIKRRKVGDFRLVRTIGLWIIYHTLAHLILAITNQHQQQHHQQQRHSTSIVFVSAEDGFPPATNKQRWNDEPPNLGATDWLRIFDEPAVAASDYVESASHGVRGLDKHPVREKHSVLNADETSGLTTSTRVRPIDLVKHHHKPGHHKSHQTEHRARLHRRQSTSHRKSPQNQHDPESLVSGSASSGSSHRFPRQNHNNNDAFFDSADRPVVSTRKGLVRGVTQKLFTGKFVDAFLGIPFAQPPVGKYRFRHPQPSKSWEGELDASKMSNSCYQVNDTFFGNNFVGTFVWNANTPLSEDCLYLNVWTPFGAANTTVVSSQSSMHHSQTGKPSNGKAPLRPVLVWIFGGGFYSGTSTLTLYEGGVLASEEDIIIVSMNYRVAALGFLYFGRSDVPGNAGLFDQLLALQWVNDNIDQFGGDPDRVTIFGESAGAVSIAFHLISPLSRNLFQQAIMQSGAATCPWGFIEPNEIIANGLQLASLVNCPSNSSDLTAVVECLVRADPMALVSQGVGQVTSIINFPFVPVVDGSFLLESPIESLAKSNYKRARILLGSNNDEGNSWLIYLPEFSQCPTSSSPPPSPPPPPPSPTVEQKQKTQPQKQSGDAEDLSGVSANVPFAHPESAELRDSAGAAGMESMDLLYSSHGSGRHQSPGGSTMSPSGTSVGSASMTGSESSNLGSNNNLDNISTLDSKPCVPNETNALTREDFLRMLKEDMNPYAEHPIGKEAIVFEYSNWNNPFDSVSNYDALDKIIGDYHFTCHVNEFAYRYALADNPVYMYYFKQRKSNSAWPKWMGVLHGDEISFVFGEPLNPVFNYTENEVKLSRRMMKYWANFAKYGNPTKLNENASMPEVWPEYSEKRQYFELHADYTRVGRGPRAKQCAFWARYLPKLIDTFDRNQCPVGSSGRARPMAPRNTLFHPEDSSNCAEQRYSLFGSHVPAPVIVSLSVILVLTIICLLVYAKNTGKLDLSPDSSSN